MKLKHILVSVLALSLTLLSCKNDKFEKEIKDVKQMREVLEGVKLTYSKVDISKADNAFSTYENNMNQIRTYYHPDSIPVDVSNLIGFYKGVKKSNKSVQSDYKLIGEHIIVVEKQLNDLVFDIEEGLVPEDSLKSFLENEHNNLQIVQDNVGTLVYSYEYMVAIHDSVSVQIQNIVLKNVK